MPKTIKSQKGTDNGNYRHGGKGTKLYEVWYLMRQRCANPKSKSYKNYGGRGIMVCEGWQSNFEAFRVWAMANGYQEGLSIDRIDNDGNYEPLNCRWTTAKEQANNQRNTRRIEYNGSTKTLHQWAEMLGMKSHTLYHRIYKLGWSIERAFSERVSLDRYHRAALEEGKG